MEWLLFAVSAYLLGSICNLLTKVLISRYVQSVVVNIAVVGFCNLLPLFLMPAQGLHLPDLRTLMLCFISGIIYVIILIPYFKALQIEEASRVVPLWRFTPLFILIFSNGMTGEKLDIYQAFAFVLLVIGGFLVSIKSLTDILKPSPAFYLMLLSCFLNAIYSCIAKFVYLHIPYYDGFTWMRLSTAVSITVFLCCLPKCRSQITQTLPQLSPKVKGLLLLNGLLEFAALALFNFAMSLAPVSLVSASAGIQAIFVLLFSILLSLKFPDILYEDMSRRVLTQKGFAVALIVIGTGMISLH